MWGSVVGVIVTLTLGLLAAPLAVQAQPPPGKTARIGYVTFRSGPSFLEEAFRQGLRDLGYVEGHNIAIEYRWANGQLDRVSALAAELVRLNVEVIVSTGGGATALAVQKAVTTMPVVFTAGDPLGIGLVARLDRPGGNVTGVSLLTGELDAKRLELLKAAVPGVSGVAVLANPANPTTGAAVKALEGAAQALRVTLHVWEARAPQEIEAAFAAMGKVRVEALLVVADPMLFAERERLVALAAQHGLPGIFEWREFVEAGGLLSYGTNIADMYRRLASYVDKILKGAKPGDLPVEQPTTFELVINLKTAQALGLTIPPTFLFQADEVIR
jgi:putative tryptophan/tyrosine transport system substrate-binding protein